MPGLGTRDKARAVRAPDCLPAGCSTGIVAGMRSVVSTVLVFLLMVGSVLAGPGHVHVTPGLDGARGPHLDHAHQEHHHGAHHDHPVPTREFDVHHHGDDAVTFGPAGVKAASGRWLPLLTASLFVPAPPAASLEDHPASPGAAPRDPPHKTGPPGRAPPA